MPSDAKSPQKLIIQIVKSIAFADKHKYYVNWIIHTVINFMHIFRGVENIEPFEIKVLHKKNVHNYVDNVYYFLYNLCFIFTKTARTARYKSAKNI